LNSFFRISWRGDYVLPACPLAQVNSAATIATKRKLGGAGFDGLFAYWTTEFEGTFAWHVLMLSAIGHAAELRLK
jgi:hypothetical protein